MMALEVWQSLYRQHIKKQRFTLQTKVHLAKAMVFQQSYTDVSGTIKNTKELMLLSVMPEKILKSPLDTKEIKPVNPKENNP